MLRIITNLLQVDAVSQLGNLVNYALILRPTCVKILFKGFKRQYEIRLSQHAQKILSGSSNLYFSYFYSFHRSQVIVVILLAFIWAYSKVSVEFKSHSSIWKLVFWFQVESPKSVYIIYIHSLFINIIILTLGKYSLYDDINTSLPSERKI